MSAHLATFFWPWGWLISPSGMPETCSRRPQAEGSRLVSPAEGTGALAPVRFKLVACVRAPGQTRARSSVVSTTTTTITTTLPPATLPLYHSTTQPDTLPHNNNNPICRGSVSTGGESPPHSGELNHALFPEGGPTQSQPSRLMSSVHHISMEHPPRRKHLQFNSDTTRSGVTLKRTTRKPLPLLSTEAQKSNFHNGNSSFLQWELFGDFSRVQRPKNEQMSKETISTRRKKGKKHVGIPHTNPLIVCSTCSSQLSVTSLHTTCHRPTNAFALTSNMSKVLGFSSKVFHDFQVFRCCLFYENIDDFHIFEMRLSPEQTNNPSWIDVIFDEK